MNRCFSLFFSILLIFSFSILCSANFDDVEVIEDEEIIEDILPDHLPEPEPDPEPDPDSDPPIVEQLPADPEVFPVEVLPSTSDLFDESFVYVGSSYIQTYASGDGLYTLLRDFIGFVPDYANQNFNQASYLYPACVILTIVIVVLVAKVLFTIVDRLI